jgi:hypothetical protein
VLALQISEELVGEQLLSENDLLGAAIHKEYKKDGGKLGPGHFIFSAFDHGKTDSGNAGSVTEFCLGQIEHFTQSNKIARQSFFVFFDFFFRKRYHIGIVFHVKTLLSSGNQDCCAVEATRFLYNYFLILTHNA